MRNPVQDHLDAVHEACLDDRSGELADHVPELARVEPERFAVCLATVDGQVYQVGDAEQTFTIQSISKPLTYALALADQGIEAVARKIDVEPSGEGFNEISLSPTTSRPRNPMINAGAITAASLVAGASADERSRRIADLHATVAGRDLTVDDALLSSERRTAHRNRAISHMLRSLDVLDGDPEEALEVYLRQCALTVDCRDLALMAATLANGGVHPRTGDRALEAPVVEHVLSVMTTCGMYDAAGDWVTSVGMPAKSGVGGGILAVLPGQVGLAVFSPRLDGHGNSVRGVEACRLLSRDLQLHPMLVGRGGRSAVRASYDLLQAPSPRRRTAAAQDVLDRVGSRARVLELHGDLLFAGAESVVRAVTSSSEGLELLVIDVRRVDQVADVARTMLLDLHRCLVEDGLLGVLVDPERRVARDDDGDGGDDDREVPVFDDRGSAVAWCEDRLLERHGDGAVPDRVELADHPALQDLDDDARRRIETLLERRSCSDGDVLVEVGQREAGGLHLLLAGRVDVSAAGTDGELRPVTSLTAGMSFGELALAGEAVQATRVTADGDVELAVLPAAELHRLEDDEPAAALALWRGMAREAAATVQRVTRELAHRAELTA